MPVTFSFDIEEASVQDANDRTRIQVSFSRFGWEHLGGSSWRYPPLGNSKIPEDWFNHVIPALMYFRALVEHSGIQVSSLTLDAHSEAGQRHSQGAGALAAASAISLVAPPLDPGVLNKLSEARLRRFVQDAANSLT